MHVTFPSGAAEGGQEDRPRRIPQMSTARGRDGRRTQSGSVKGVVVPASDPGMAEPYEGSDRDDFYACSRFSFDLLDLLV